MPRINIALLQEILNLSQAVDEILNTDEFRVSDGVGDLLVNFEGLGERLKKQVAQAEKQEGFDRNLYTHWSEYYAKVVKRFFRINPEANATCARYDIAVKLVYRTRDKGTWLSYPWTDILINYLEQEGYLASREIYEMADQIAYLSEHPQP